MKSFNIDLFPADAIVIVTSNSDAHAVVPAGWYLISTSTSSGTTSLSMNASAATGSPAIVPAGFFPAPFFVRQFPAVVAGSAATALTLHAITNTSSATGTVTLIPLTSISGS